MYKYHLNKLLAESAIVFFKYFDAGHQGHSLVLMKAGSINVSLFKYNLLTNMLTRILFGSNSVVNDGPSCLHSGMEQLIECCTTILA